MDKIGSAVMDLYYYYYYYCYYFYFTLTQAILVLRPTCFTPFLFNVPCQYAPLPNIDPPIFRLSWLHSITLTSACSSTS
jgi:hypothetical protein